MNSQLMTSRQQSTPSALWSLGTGEAFRLDVGPGDREVHVTEGRLWLTREGTPQSPPEDIWLEAGDSIALTSGSQWVAEGWGATRFQLLVPPRACATLSRRVSVSAWRRASASLVPAWG
ncbi:MAG: DUF2917 domain-containing protein [Rhizobacter sp.]